jgi:HEAT repeats
MEGLEKLKSILQGKLPESEIESLLLGFTSANGECSVSIEGNVKDAIIVTGNKNVIGDNNRITINNSNNADEIRELFLSFKKDFKAYRLKLADDKKHITQNKSTLNKKAANVKNTLVRRPVKSTRNLTLAKKIEISKHVSVLNLDSNSAIEKITALRKLGKIGKDSDTANSGIIRVIQRDKNNAVIAEGIITLSKITKDPKSVVPMIVRLLKFRPSDLVIISAMESFSKIAHGNTDAVDMMLILLSDKNDTKVQLAIINGLGKVAIGQRKAIDKLLSILRFNSSNKTIKKSAANSLGQIAVEDQIAISEMSRLLMIERVQPVKERIRINLNKIKSSK